MANEIDSELAEDTAKSYTVVVKSPDYTSVIYRKVRLVLDPKFPHWIGVKRDGLLIAMHPMGVRVEIERDKVPA